MWWDIAEHARQTLQQGLIWQSTNRAEDEIPWPRRKTERLEIRWDLCCAFNDGLVECIICSKYLVAILIRIFHVGELYFFPTNTRYGHITCFKQ